MTHNDRFDETFDLYFSIGFWMLYIDGNIAEFANIRVEVCQQLIFSRQPFLLAQLGSVMFQMVRMEKWGIQ
jgi:hypothetical protein